MSPANAAVAAAALFLGLAVAAAPPDGADDKIPVLNESMAWDYSYMMEDMIWPGPNQGCAPAEGAGGAELRLLCALSAARVTLSTDRAATYLNVECERDDKSAGRITCEELRQNASEALWIHTGEAMTQYAGGSRVLRSLSLIGCEMTEPLQCLLELVAASDVVILELKAVPMPLPSDQLQGLNSLTHLRILDIDKNVTRLPYAALASLSSLRRLDMHGGAWELTAGGEDWRPLRQLQMLELAAGELRSLPARAFSPLSQLRNLSLWANQIETLDENALEGLSQLECLSLNRNRLKELLPRTLLPTPRLRLLHLFDNQIPALPQLGHLKSLEEVWLNNRNTTSLSLDNDTFANLPALSKLKLDSCGVVAVPAQLLHGCCVLVELSLRGNWLTELPPGLLAEQSSLRVLDLGHNRLRTLPRTLLVNTKAVEELNLSGNYIEVLPNGIFLSLSSLQKLDLSRNNLGKLHPQVFEGLSNIIELSLSYNKLTMAVDADVATRAMTSFAELTSPLAALKSLTHISLAHNDVRYFMDDWRELHHLEELDLSYNSIEELSDVDLQLLSEALVDVRHNKITRVQQMQDAELEAIRGELSRARFLLDNNPFHCDCGMYDFLVSLRRPTIAAQFDVGGAQCSAPLSQSGKLLGEVQPDQLVCPLPPADCPGNCTCELRPSTRTVELDCQSVNKTMPNPSKYGARGMRLRLHAPLADVGWLPASVRHVDLSGLQLTEPPVATAIGNRNLTVDLSNNSLTSAPLALFKANCKVLLANNPLACDCDHHESIAALRRNWALVADGDALRCTDGQWVRGKDAEALCAGRQALALGLSSGVAIALVVLIIFRYRTEVRLILGRFKLFDFLLPKKDLGMLQKRYDVFVSFSHHDDVFVREVLVPALEGGRRPLRLCLHYRDWEVGDLIPEQIDRSVRESWRTLVVLSEDFVRSMWGRHEFRAAHGMERVIVLVLGDALRAMEADKELRAYKKTHTCIMASHPLVWDRIRDAVYRSKCAAPAPPKLADGNVIEDEGKKVYNGLNVQLLNGQLVTESVIASPTTPKNLTFYDSAFINNNLCQKISDNDGGSTGVLGKWFRSSSKNHIQNNLRLPK